MSRQQKFVVTGAILLVFAFLIPVPALAQQGVATKGLVVDCNHIVSDGNGSVTVDKMCTLKDFFTQFVILAQFGYSLIAVLAMLMFVYGGFQFLTAGGRQEKVTMGRRVISGTIIGLAVSLTAYVIINFTVSAITGATTRSFNPFGGIALVFPNLPEQQPFSGNQGTTSSVCRTTWDNSCSNQVYCSDPGSTPGPIHRYQGALNGLGCSCGTPDGCYGAMTVACVRRFQIANAVSPSGVLDQNTFRFLDPYLNAVAAGDTFEQQANIDLYGCSRAGVAATVTSVSSQLPEPASSTAAVKQASATTSGCCLVKKTVGGVAQPYYCVDQVSQRACAGLANNTLFASGQDCASAPETKDVCGLCANLSSNTCFAGSGRFWCQQIVSPPQSFTAGRCPDPRCSSQCDSGLRTSL